MPLKTQEYGLEYDKEYRYGNERYGNFDHEFRQREKKIEKRSVTVQTVRLKALDAGKIVMPEYAEKEHRDDGAERAYAHQAKAVVNGASPAAHRGKTYAYRHYIGHHYGAHCGAAGIKSHGKEIAGLKK